jgi:hypothetical protein
MVLIWYGTNNGEQLPLESQGTPYIYAELEVTDSRAIDDGAAFGLTGVENGHTDELCTETHILRYGHDKPIKVAKINMIP